jgi:putative hydrolase of HD superfamily
MSKQTPPPTNPTTDINFLFEIGNLRHVARTWNQFGGLNVANDTDHSFRTAMIAWLIAEREGVDTNRVVKMALIHDMQEIRTGDINYLQRLYVTRDEETAIVDQTAGLPIQNEMLELWREYEERETLAAKIVKDADVLDQDLEVMEMISRGEDFGQIMYDKRDGIIRDKLFTETARQFFDTIRVGSPNAWHADGKNRFTHGDWKK